MSENFWAIIFAGVLGLRVFCGLQHLAQERRFLVLTPYIALSPRQNVYLHGGISVDKSAV